MNICSVPGCGKRRHAHGLCQNHDNRRRRHGDPLWEPDRSERLCTIPGCGEKHVARGLCWRHYMQQRLHSDALHADKAAAAAAEAVLPSRHPLGSRWNAIRSRCYNPRADNYPHYGGRGLRMCDRWRDEFAAFVADIEREIGAPPDQEWQLDRIDTNGHYEPGNVRWATPALNSRNRRNTTMTQERADAIRERRGRGETIKTIARDLGLAIGTVHSVLTGQTWNDDGAADLRVRRLDRSSPCPVVDVDTLANVADHHPLFGLYKGIKQRLTNPKHVSYLSHGGRGIRMHAPWMDDARRFIREVEAEIGPRPTLAHSLDRIDNDGHYEPGNLRWATYSMQTANRRRKDNDAAG